MPIIVMKTVLRNIEESQTRWELDSKKPEGNHFWGRIESEGHSVR